MVWEEKTARHIEANPVSVKFHFSLQLETNTGQQAKVVLYRKCNDTRTYRASSAAPYRSIWLGPIETGLAARSVAEVTYADKAKKFTHSTGDGTHAMRSCSMLAA